MTPEVICIDCNLALPHFPDKFFDWAIVDPPYFYGPDKRGYYGKREGGIIQRRDYPKIQSWDIPNAEYFRQLIRVSKNQIVWGINYFDVVLGPGRIIWDKVNGKTSFSDAEIAYVSSHDSVRMFRYMWNGAMQGKSWKEGHIMQGNKKLNQARIHPTEKPVALYQWIYERYKIQPGMKVLDTHLGSGTHRVVAHAYEVDFWGYEKDPVVFALQEDHFVKSTLLPLFSKE